MNYRSIRDAVWACRAIGGSAKLVALRLVEHWPRIMPSLASLCEFTGLSERTIRDALRELEERKVISTMHRPGERSEYAFVGVIIPDLGTPANSAGPPRQILPDPPANSAGPTPANSAPEADKDLSRQRSGQVEAGNGARTLLPHEISEARKAQRLEANGAQPVLKYQFPEDWNPHKKHMARAAELGLTEAEVWERVEDVRLKPIKAGYTDEDKHFMRELVWARDAKEVKKAKESAYANRKDFEIPGHSRTR